MVACGLLIHHVMDDMTQVQIPTLPLGILQSRSRGIQSPLSGFQSQPSGFVTNERLSVAAEWIITTHTQS